MKLECIDVFSGIGGVSVGLGDFTQTIQYCEWDEYCKQVLVNRMEDGLIDKAPIHGDIKNLHISPCTRPRMLSGGFPCQDISMIGLQKGILNGERSSMFYHMMRIVDECPSIDVVLLENVANILSVGMKEVIDELTARGFNLMYKIFTASEMGAPHQRARWFCLALKPGVDLSGLDLESKVKNHWTEEPPRRFTYKPAVKEDPSYDPNWIQRCQTLGNTVVPWVVREAFRDLALSSLKWSTIADCLQEFKSPVSSVTYPYPECGFVYNGEFYAMPKRVQFPFKHNVQITMNDGAIKLCNYPTPRRGITHPSSLTDRAIRDLPTVLVHSDQTREVLKEEGAFDPGVNPHSVLLPNVNYIEWMMGYAPNWTHIRGGWSVNKSRYAPSYETGEDGQIEEAEFSSSSDPMTGGRQQSRSSRGKRGHGGSGRTYPTRHNGLHMLMKDYPGKDIRFIASIWRGLTDEQRKSYSEKAKTLVHGGVGYEPSQ